MRDDFLPDRNSGQRSKDLPAEGWAVALIVLGLGLLILGISNTPTAIRLNSNQAVPGTYLVEGSPSCGRGGRTCISTTGSFVSDDGTIVRTGVYLRGIPKPVKRGDRVRAFDVGEQGRVFLQESETGWPFLGPIAFGVLGLLVLGFGSWRLRRWWKS